MRYKAETACLPLWEEVHSRPCPTHRSVLPSPVDLPRIPEGGLHGTGTRGTDGVRRKLFTVFRFVSDPGTGGPRGLSRDAGVVSGERTPAEAPGR